MAKKVEALESRRRVSSIPIPVMCQKVANRKEKWEIEYLLSASPAVPALSSPLQSTKALDKNVHFFFFIFEADRPSNLDDQMMANVNF